MKKIFNIIISIIAIAFMCSTTSCKSRQEKIYERADSMRTHYIADSMNVISKDGANVAIKYQVTYIGDIKYQDEIKLDMLKYARAFTNTLVVDSILDNKDSFIESNANNIRFKYNDVTITSVGFSIKTNVR